MASLHARYLPEQSDSKNDAGVSKRDGDKRPRVVATYYLQYYLPGNVQRRINLHTNDKADALRKKLQFEYSQMTGGVTGLPTRTAVPEILSAYVQHIRTANKDGEDWKETHSFNREDLLHAAKLLDSADSIIHREEEDRRRQQQDSAKTE